MSEDFLDEILTGSSGTASSPSDDFLGEILSGTTKPPAPVHAAPAAQPIQAAGNRVLGAVSDAATSVKKFATGEDAREFDFGELPQNVWVNNKMVPIQSDLSLARGNPIAAAAIFKDRVPNADVEFDAMGNPYTTHGGEKKYLNRPGFSGGDINRGITEVGSMVMASRGGAGLLRKLGLAGKMTGAGVANYGTSLGIDKIAQIAGSPVPVDQKRALIIGALGFGGEAVAPIAEKFLTAFFGNPRMDAAEGLTAEGRKVLERIGVDPAYVTREFEQAFARQAARAVNPDEAAGVALAESLPRPVVLTTGDITRDVSQQAFEDAALKGARGEIPKQIMRGVRDGNQTALKENAVLIQDQLAGGVSQVTVRGEGAAAAAKQVKNLARSEKDFVDRAYDIARQGDTLAPVEIVQAMRNDIGSVLKERGFDVGRMQLVQRRLADADNILAEKSVSAVKINAMELWRKRLVRDIETARRADPSEAEALRAVRNTYDGWLEGAIEKALIIGDEEGIRAWQAARAINTRYSQMFKSDKTIAKIVEGDLTTEQSLSLIFGQSKLGAKQESAHTLKRIKKLLGEESSEWRALKEEGFLRLLKSQDTGPRGRDLEVMFSGDKFATAFDAAMKDAPSVMKTLYTAREQALFHQMKHVALRATNRVPGAVNSSNSAHEIARIMQQLLGSGSRVLQVFINRFARRFVDESDILKTKDAVTFTPMPRRLIPPGTVGGTASGIGGSVIDPRTQ